MSKTATMDIVISVQGDGTNDSWRLSTFNPIVLTDSPGNRTVYSLSAGFNSITCPKAQDGGASSYAVIIPQVGSTNVKTLKGVTGDTGTSFTSQEFVVPIASGTTSIGITSVATDYIEIYWI